MALANFPSRVRFVNADGTLTAEAYRFLVEIFDRIGGAVGNNGVDTFAIDTFALESANTSIGAEFVMQAMELQSAAPAEMLSQPAQVAQADYMADMVFAGETSGARLQAVTAGASPYTYRAQGPGVVSVEGGIVSGLSLTRAGISITLGQVAGVIPVGTGDALVVTYTSVPNIHFIPR